MSRLLLLSPSRGLGGGIERVGDAIEGAWEGPAERLDLLDDDEPDLGWPRKTRYGFKALREARRFEPDLVFCLHTGLLPVAAGVAAASGSPLAVWAHGTEVWHELGPFERRCIRSAEHLFASSAFTQEWLAFRARIPRERIHVLPLPVAGQLAERARSFNAPDSREPLFLTVSRLVPEHRYKGHLDIAESLPFILEEVPSARWVVAGDGSDLPMLQARCADLGVEHAVRFAGRVSDEELAQLYSSASAFVLPSIALPDVNPPAGEGLGLVYVEAGAFELPSVASSLSGGAKDFVRHDETGLHVPPGRPEWLARAACRLLTDTALRTRLGKSARSLFLERHMPERFAAELSRALESGRSESRQRA